MYRYTRITKHEDFVYRLVNSTQCYIGENKMSIDIKITTTSGKLSLSKTTLIGC